MSSKRWITVTITSALALMAVVWGFMPEPVPVDAVKVFRGPLRVTVDEEGKTRVRDRFVVSAPMRGYIQRIRLEVGDPVKKGEKVAELEPSRSEPLDPRSLAQAKAAISAAESMLKSAILNADSAEAEAEFSRKQLERSRKLFQDGYISREILDQAETDARYKESIRLASEASVKAAAAELERTTASLLYSEKILIKDDAQIVSVHSPVAGRVLKIHRESAGPVNSGEALMEIGDPDQLEVVVEVLSRDAVKIKNGAPVHFERWGGNTALEGRVRNIEPTGFTKISSLGVEEQRVQAIVDITSDKSKWKSLGDGYSMETSFILWEGSGVLQVPTSALFRQGDGYAVFVIEKKRALLRPVQTGHSNGLATEILSGLVENEDIITHPDQSIMDGIKVKVR